MINPLPLQNMAATPGCIHTLYSVGKAMRLKTLFNIVEAPFKKLLNFDVCVVWWCSDGPLNSQEYKSFEIYVVSIKISMTEYHLLNKRSGRPFILTQQSIGRNEYGISGHLHIFCFFEALNGAFEVQFFRASFLHRIKDTDSM